MTGCLEKVPEISVASSEPHSVSHSVLQDQSAMQMDFDAELGSDLFGVRGNIMLPGNSSLAYIMLNATLCQGEKAQFSTKYLLMQIEPNRDYNFEISKNVKIPAGEYDCILVATGPQGVLAKESRKISLASVQNPVFEQVPWPVELDEKVSGEENKEVLPKEESIAQKDVSNDDANDAAGKKDPVAMTGKESEDGKFMGSITSKKYHRLDCRYALKIKPENRIYFQSIEDAKGQGYLPCKTCAP